MATHGILKKNKVGIDSLQSNNLTAQDSEHQRMLNDRQELNVYDSSNSKNDGITPIQSGSKSGAKSPNLFNSQDKSNPSSNSNININNAVNKLADKPWYRNKMNSISLGDNTSKNSKLKHHNHAKGSVLFHDPTDTKIQGIMQAIYKNFSQVMHIERMKSIKQAMMKHLMLTQSRKYKNLDYQNYQVINDRALVIEDIKKNLTCKEKISSYLANIDYYYAKMFKSFKTSHPKSDFNFYLQIIEAMVIVTNMICFTWFIFFEFYSQDFFFYLNVSTVFIYLLSMFQRTNTAYVDQGQVIYDRQKIMKNYRNSLFLFDLIPLISMLYISVVRNDDFATKVICLGIYFKSKVQARIYDNIEEKLNLSGNMVHVWTLFLLLGQSLALCHAVGTMYYFVSFLEKEYFDVSETWVEVAGIQDRHPIEIYIQSYYWALATIMLIGSKGDTTIETVFCIVSLLYTVGMFAKILSAVAMVMEQLEEGRKNYKKDKEVLNTFFSLHPAISHDLQGQLHNYLKYHYEGHEEKNANQDFEFLITDKFPGDLQELVRDERYKSQIQHFKLFEQFSQQTVKQLISYVEEEYYMPNQIIFQREVYEEPKIYLILSGKVEMYQETGEVDSVLQVYGKGEYFGQNTFFTNSIPYYSARSTEDEFTTVLVISRSNFLEIIKGNTQDNEKYSTIKDQMFLHGCSDIINHKCLICHNKYHSEDQCGLINYYPNRLNMAMRLNYSVNQDTQPLPYKYETYNETGKLTKLTVQRKEVKTRSLSQGPINAEKAFNILENPKLRKFFKPIQDIQKQLQAINDADEDEEEETMYTDEEYSDCESNQGFTEAHAKVAYQNPMSGSKKRSNKKIGTTAKRGTHFSEIPEVTEVQQFQSSNNIVKNQNQEGVILNSQTSIMSEHSNQMFQMNSSNYQNTLEDNPKFENDIALNMEFQEYHIQLDDSDAPNNKNDVTSETINQNNTNRNQLGQQQLQIQKSYSSKIGAKIEQTGNLLQPQYAGSNSKNNNLSTSFQPKRKNNRAVTNLQTPIGQRFSQQNDPNNIQRSNKRLSSNIQSPLKRYPSQAELDDLDYQQAKLMKVLLEIKNNQSKITSGQGQIQSQIQHDHNFGQESQFYMGGELKEYQLFIPFDGMDIIQSFQYYFIHNNHDQVLKDYKKYMRKVTRQRAQANEKGKKKINKAFKKVSAFNF